METYDPKAKKLVNTVTTKSGEILTVGCRVRYVGSTPCFVGDFGVLKKIKREWRSARRMSRAGFAGSSPYYAMTALVLWDQANQHGPQGCDIEALTLEPINHLFGLQG